LFWSTVPTAFKISLEELEIIPLLTLASSTSALILFFIIIAEKKISLLKKTTLRDYASSAILGFINPFIYYIILLSAYQLLPAQVAQPLNMIWPIVLVFLSVPILKQKIPGKSYLALLVSFAGVYIISSQGNFSDFGRSNLKGILLATGSSVFWAFYFIMNVRDKRDEAVKLFLNFLFGSMYLVTALLITGKWQLPISAKGAISSIYIGLFEMGITFYLWLKALKLAPSTDRVSNLVYLDPFIALIFVHFIIGEPIFYTTPIGLLIIIGGIMISNIKHSQI
jgi:drug/metabolite transporter (DMT)-like permease